MVIKMTDGIIENFDQMSWQEIRGTYYGEIPYRIQTRQKLKFFCGIDCAKMIDRLIRITKQRYDHNVESIKIHFSEFHEKYISGQWEARDIVCEGKFNSFLAGFVIALERDKSLIDNLMAMRRGLPELKPGYEWNQK